MVPLCVLSLVLHICKFSGSAIRIQLARDLSKSVCCRHPDPGLLPSLGQVVQVPSVLGALWRPLPCFNFFGTSASNPFKYVRSCHVPAHLPVTSALRIKATNLRVAFKALGGMPATPLALCSHFCIFSCSLHPFPWPSRYSSDMPGTPSRVFLLPMCSSRYSHGMFSDFCVTTPNSLGQ